MHCMHSFIVQCFMVAGVIVENVLAYTWQKRPQFLSSTGLPSNGECFAIIAPFAKCAHVVMNTLSAVVHIGLLWCIGPRCLCRAGGESRGLHLSDFTNICVTL